MSQFLRRHGFRWTLCTLIVVIFDVIFPTREPKPLTRRDLIEDGALGAGFTLGISVITTVTG